MKVQKHMLLALVAGLLMSNSAQGMAARAYKANVKKVQDLLNSSATSITQKKLDDANKALTVLEKGIDKKKDPSRFKVVQVLRTQYNTLKASRGLSARDQVVADLRAKLVAISNMLDNAETAAASDQKQIIENIGSTVDGYKKELDADLKNLKMTEEQFFASAGSLENDLHTTLKRARDLSSEIYSGSTGGSAGSAAAAADSDYDSDTKRNAGADVTTYRDSKHSAEQPPEVPAAAYPSSSSAAAAPQAVSSAPTSSAVSADDDEKVPAPPSEPDSQD